jgi:hypothetical protein
MKDLFFINNVFKKITCLILLSTLASCVFKREDLMTNDGTSFTDENGVCHNVNPGSQLHPVILCENKDALTIRVLKNLTSIDKKLLEKTIHQQLKSLVNATDIDRKYLSSADVDVWISAPVLDPEQAELVVVIKGKMMGFAVFLPIDLKHWDFLSSSVVQLGASGYPSMQTWKSGRFVMAANRSIKNADWLNLKQDLKAEAGATPAGLPRIKQIFFNGEGIVFDTEKFSESYVAAYLQKTKIGKKYNLQPVWIPAVESDAYKAKGYSFKLDI